MSWLKVDDKMHDHRKVRRAGLEATGLWLLAATWAADNLTDGFVPTTLLSRWTSDPSLADRLVDAGLWSPSQQDDEDGYLFHDWTDYQPSSEKVRLDRRLHALKQKLVRNPSLRDLVRRRDQDTCRYCSRKVSWADRRSATAACYSHVDVSGETNAANVVVACKACDSLKAGGALADVGMRLLPEPLDPDVSGYAEEPAPPVQAVPRYAPRTDLDTSTAREQHVRHPVPSRPDPSRPEGQGTGRGRGSARAHSAPAALPIPSEARASSDEEVAAGDRPSFKTALPETWKPTPAHEQQADQLQVDLEQEAELFRAHAIATQARQCFWDLSFTDWLRKSANRNRGRLPSHQEVQRRGARIQSRMDALMGKSTGADAPAQRPDDVVEGQVVEGAFGGAHLQSAHDEQLLAASGGHR